MKLYHVFRRKFIHESNFISGSENAFFGSKIIFADEFYGVKSIIWAFVLKDITVGA